MPTLSNGRIVELLQPFAVGSEELSANLSAKVPHFSTYLDLLIRWNARTNLSAIREPEEIVQRHFGESVFTATLIGVCSGTATLLDLGSGAGFPGLPIQICMPELQVTLAESQGKKASFLREIVRTLGLGTEVWAARAEEMPNERRFSVATLRAVDRMKVASATAEQKVAHDGRLLVLAGEEFVSEAVWRTRERVQIPSSTSRFVHVLQR